MSRCRTRIQKNYREQTIQGVSLRCVSEQTKPKGLPCNVTRLPECQCTISDIYYDKPWGAELLNYFGDKSNGFRYREGVVSFGYIVACFLTFALIQSTYCRVYSLGFYCAFKRIINVIRNKQNSLCSKIRFARVTCPTYL